MKSVIFLLLLISISLYITTTLAASGYVDKNGNPASNPCKNGENVYFDTLIFNCIDGKKVYYGCKINGAEVPQDTLKDENNLRTLYCHKDGSSVKTIVTGCVTDDNQFINETKTIKQVDGTEFSCTQQSNGFSYIKKSPPTKVSDCAAGQTKLVSGRYLLNCFEETSGYFTYKLAACYHNVDNDSIKVEVTKTYDDYVSADKNLGFRYQCYAQGGYNYFYDPIGCLLGKEMIAPGNIFQNNSLTVMCMREGPHLLRLRPVYSSGGGNGGLDEKLCTETKTYIEGSFKYECVTGKLPKPIACIFFKNAKEISIGSTYNDDKAYQYKCELTSDGKHLALIKIACLDDENQILMEGGKKSLSDGSRIECQKSEENDGLLRVIIGGKPPINLCKNGEKFVKDYLQYQCQTTTQGQGGYKPFACAPLNNDTLIIEIGKTYDSENYQYKCENIQGSTTIIYHAIACLDSDKKVIMPGEKKQVKIFTYECQRKANNDLVLIISNEKGCKHPTLQGKLVRPKDIIEVSRTINGLEYKTLFQCVEVGGKGSHGTGGQGSGGGQPGGYHLIDFACKVNGKKYNVGNFVPNAKDVYKCVRQITGYVYLIYIPINQLTCRFNGKTYNNGDEFKSDDGVNIYECRFGGIIKTGCFVHDKRIPANQLMYCNNDPYYCPGQGEGVIPIPIRGCIRKDGKIILIGENFVENDITYSCSYTHYHHIYKPVIVPIGCVYKGKTIPLSGYSMDENSKKYIVCEIDGSFTVIVHPATPDQEQCIAKTNTYNCQENGNGNGGGGNEPGTGDNGGGEVTPPSGNNGDYTATPDSGHGDGNTGNPGSTNGGHGNNGNQGFPTDENGNPISSTPSGPGTTTTDDCDDEISSSTPSPSPSGGGGGNTPSNPTTIDDDDDCDDVTGQPPDGPPGSHHTRSTKGPGHPSDHTATGHPGSEGPGGEIGGTTIQGGGGNNNNPFPTDSNGNPITPNPSGGDHTATGNPGSEHPGHGSHGTTIQGGGNDNNNPFPTDENGNPITKNPNGGDHTATGKPGSDSPSGEVGGTTKEGGGNGNNNPFPTDSNGNPVTHFPGEHTATGGEHGGHTPPGSHDGTTKGHSETGSGNPFPTDDHGNPITPSPSVPGSGDHTATGGEHGGNTPPGSNEGSTNGGGITDGENPFPTDHEGHHHTRSTTLHTGNSNEPSSSHHPTGPGDHTGPGVHHPTGPGHHHTRSTPDHDGNGPTSSHSPPGDNNTPDGPGGDHPTGPGHHHSSSSSPHPGNPNEPSSHQPGDNNTPSIPGDNSGSSTTQHSGNPNESTTTTSSDHPGGPGDHTGPGGHHTPSHGPHHPTGPGEDHPTGPGHHHTPPPGHTNPPPSTPQKCKDLLPKEICQQLQPLCVPHTLRKVAANQKNKADRDSLLLEINKSNKNINNALPEFVKKGIIPQSAVSKIKKVPIFKTLPTINKKVNVNCIALQEQCMSNTEPLACINYFSKCSNDLSGTSVCKVTTTCTTTKEIYGIITSEIISKLCPETCLVQECYDNHTKPGKLDLSHLINPELLMCLLA